MVLKGERLVDVPEAQNCTPKISIWIVQNVVLAIGVMPKTKTIEVKRDAECMSDKSAIEYRLQSKQKLEYNGWKNFGMMTKQSKTG